MARKESSRSSVPAVVRVGLYTRISTDEDHQPYSLGAQADRLEAYVTSQENWRIQKRYEDQMTGTVLDRPGLQSALTDARQGRFDLLLVFRVDRLARSVRTLAAILEDLDQHGVAFRSATEPFDTSSPAGRMMVQMLGVFAEFERATLIERVIAGMTKKAARGGWNGGSRPFGYDYDDETGCLAVNSDESPIVAKVFEMYTSKQMGAPSIARWLNDQGYRTKRGARWRTNSVLVLLNNPAYIGKVFFRDETYQGQHQPIIGVETFECARALLQQRGEDIASRRRNRSEYPLSGLLICEKCGSRFVGAGAHGNGGNYRYYLCAKRQSFGTAACDQDRIPADKIEEALFVRLREVLGESEILRRATAKFADQWNGSGRENEEECRRIDKDIRQAKEAIDKYLHAFEDGTMPPDACGPRIEEWRDRIAGLESRKADLESEATVPQDPPSFEDVAEAAERVVRLLEQFREEDVSALKGLLGKLVKQVDVESRVRVYPAIHLPLVLIMDSWVGPAGFEPATNGL